MRMATFLRRLLSSLAEREARTLVLAGATAVYAVPVGLGLAWMLLVVVNVEAFGWRLPMRMLVTKFMRLISGRCRFPPGPDTASPATCH